MKKQRKRTLRPFELWDAKQVEQWLEDEARRGWQLSDCGSYRATFEAIEPGEYRVRLEPQRLETPEDRQERGEVYREMGWNCTAVLCDGGQDYEVYYCADPEIPELHTDPAVYRWAWEKSLRRSARNAWIQILLSVVLLLIPVLFALLQNETPLQSLLTMPLLMMYTVLAMVPVFFISAIRQMYTVRKFRRQLKADVVPSSGGDWKKRRRWWRAFAVLIIVYWLLYVLGSVGNVMWSYRSEAATEELPYVSATELAPETVREDWEFEVESFVQKSTPLNPAREEIQFCAEGQRRVRNTGDRLQFEFLAKALYQEKLEAFRADWPEAEQTAVENEAFDEAVLLTGGEDVQMLLVRSGKIVYSLWVNFPADLSAGIESAAECLSA